jgi:hypothetical protein
VRHPLGDCEGEAGLAAAARPGEREQPPGTEQRDHPLNVRLPPDEARGSTGGWGPIFNQRGGEVSD